LRVANVTICSPFRDSIGNIDAYINRIADLDYPLNSRRYVWVEGDSQDGTWDELQMWADTDDRVMLVKCDTGKPRYSSIVSPVRFAALAKVFNAALDAVDLEWSDYVLFLPSDIHYALDLLNKLVAHDKDIVAPFVYDAPQGRPVFFDTWAFVKDGKNFTKFSRANALVAYGPVPIQMDTVGSTVLIRADVLRAGCRYTSEDVDRGLCECAKAKGFTIWADPSTSVYHPPLVPGLKAIANQDAQTVKAGILAKYGFEVTDEYARDFVAFVEGLTLEPRK
jgi:hypothetical protein